MKREVGEPFDLLIFLTFSHLLLILLSSIYLKLIQRYHIFSGNENISQRKKDQFYLCKAIALINTHPIFQQNDISILLYRTFKVSMDLN